MKNQTTVPSVTFGVETADPSQPDVQHDDER
jgi:hypothetical protein